MEKEIKTISDVLSVPATEFIQTVNFQTRLCPFCGAKLPYKMEKIGSREHRRLAYLYRKPCPCDCPTALAAIGHNYIVKALQKEASLRKASAPEQA